MRIAPLAAASLGLVVTLVPGCSRESTAPTSESAAASSESAEPTSPGAPDSNAWRADLDAWIEERYANLRKPDGWLSLAGLFWLEPGESTFGADPGNDLVFPAGKSPPRIGVLTVTPGPGPDSTPPTVRIRVEDGVAVTHDGEPVREMELVTDAAGDPTMLELGPLLFHALDRGGRPGIRLKDRESPLISSFAGIDRYPPDPAWRLEARFERYDPPKEILVPNVVGPALAEPCPGRLVFDVGGETLSLEPTGEPGEDLFVVFGDSTNGAETYGGGRFLYADWPGASGTTTLDFNRAYNPPCVFTPWATCPLPPPQNKLALAVTAGEKTYHGAGAH